MWNQKKKKKDKEKQSFIKFSVNIFTIVVVFFSFPFLFFNWIQLCYIKAKHSRLSAQSPMTCRYLCFPPLRWYLHLPSLLSMLTIHHISVHWDTRLKHKVSFHQKLNWLIEHKSLRLHEIRIPIINGFLFTAPLCVDNITIYSADGYCLRGWHWTCCRYTEECAASLSPMPTELTKAP